MTRLLKFFGQYKKKMMVSPLLVMIEVACELAQPFIMSEIIDKGIASGDMAYIIRMGIYMVLVAALSMGAGMASAYFSAIGTQGLGANLRKQMFSKVQTFSFRNIDHFSSASLVTRLTNDVNLIQMTAQMTIRQAVRVPFTMIAGVAMALAINGRLALILTVSMPLLIIGTAVVFKMTFPRFVIAQEKLDALNGNIQENLTNMRVIKSFVRQDYEKKKFSKSSGDLMTANLRAMKLSVVQMPLMTLVMNMTTVAVLWFGGQMLMEGMMEPGKLISFITYMTQILMAVVMISFTLNMVSRSKASLIRIYEVLDTEPEMADGTNMDAGITKGRVEFRNVSFKYEEEGEENVLKNVSFTAEPGEFVAIVGRTGSAKTTLVSLIPRFYDVLGGEVLIDGVNVKDYTMYNLRRNIGMVMQKNMLFSGSIKENISWGLDNAEDSQIEEAAKSAQAAQFIEQMPYGYDSELGQGGVNLSGGQKQRVCIARALLKKPPILILDDSTSAVDSATEIEIRKALSEHLSDTTTFIIAQRISSVRDADKIIVLDDGKIVGIGDHDTLMRDSEQYRAIYESQQREVKE